MSNVSEYKDIVAFHPGYYIADIIEDMGISWAGFTARIGITAKALSQLINGQANISNDLAKNLSVMIGIQQAKDFDGQKELAKRLTIN